MNKKIEEAATNLQAEIEHVNNCLHWLYIISSTIDRDYGMRGRSQEEYNALHAALYRRQLDLWRSLMMLALSFDDEQLAEIKRKTFKRFLEKGTSVAYLLDRNCTHPGMWDSGEEDELRKELDAAFNGETAK